MSARIDLDFTSFVQERNELEKRHIPFAVAATLTAVIQDAQKEVKRNVRTAFKLRNTFTEQGIRIKTATPTQLEASIYTDTANRKTGAPDYLGRQETGGERVPINGHNHIAIPTDALRRLAPGVIPAELRPKNLLGAVQGRYTDRNRKTGQLALKAQKVVRGYVFFVQTLKTGSVVILGRNAAGKSREIKAFYLLVREVHVKKSGLLMEDTTRAVVNDRLERHWDLVWDRIYIKGLRV